jgi:hypothetical protein
MDYYENTELAELYLEDSFVTDFRAGPNSARLEIEVVLREGHPLYVAPNEDEEQYCYRRGSLNYGDVKTFTWRMPTGSPATDATGEADYGGIESYTIEGNRHHFQGEIGEVLITCENFKVEFLPEEDDPQAAVE